MEKNEKPTNLDTTVDISNGPSGATAAENSATPDARWTDAANRADCALASFIDEDAAREFILHQLHPGQQPICPECGAALDDETTQRNFWAGRRCTCKQCGRWFSATSGTYLQGTQLSFAQLFLLFNLLDLSTGEITPGRISIAVGVSVDTVRGWKLRLKDLSRER